MTNLKKITGMFAVGALAFGVANAANAFVQAQSVVNFNDFTISDEDGILDLEDDFVALVFTSSANTAVSINNGPIQGESGDQIPIDLPLVCVGNGCPQPGLVENAFPELPRPSDSEGSYAAADTNEIGSPITGITDEDDVELPTPASLSNGSWAGIITGDGSASSESNNTLSSTFAFTLTGDPGTQRELSFDFFLDAFLNVAVTADERAPGVAEASYSVVLNLTGFPAGGEGGFPGSFEQWTDADQLQSRSLNAPTPAGELMVDVDEAKNWTVTVLEGVQYQLSARITTEADVTRVPAPATIALFGLGLVSMAAFRRRRLGA